jgi:O-antigen/teichoic acid export membrane protein
MERLLIKKTIKTDVTWLLSGNVLYSACQWAIVLALAKLGSPQQVGEYALGMAVSAPIVLLANFQLRALLASDVWNQFTFSKYLTFRLVSLGLALLVVACAAVYAQEDWGPRGIILLVGFGQVLEYISETYYGLMQKHERIDRIAWSLLLKGPVSLAALCVAMYITRSIAWAVCGLALGRLAILLVWDSRIGFTTKGGHAPAVRIEWDGGDMLGLLRAAFPLGVISMLGSLIPNIPRYFINVFEGNAGLGIFSAIASLLSAGTLVVSAFGQASFLPVVTACAEGDRTRYRMLIWQAVALGGGLGCVAVVASVFFGRSLLIHLFRQEYGGYTDVLVRLMIAGLLMFMASGLGYIMTAARRLRPQIPLLLLAAVAAVATSAWSIPRHGLRGAADAVLISAFVQLVGTGVILWQIDGQLRSSEPVAAFDGPGRRAEGTAAVAKV